MPSRQALTARSPATGPGHQRPEKRPIAMVEPSAFHIGLRARANLIGGMFAIAVINGDAPNSGLLFHPRRVIVRIMVLIRGRATAA